MAVDSAEKYILLVTASAQLNKRAAALWNTYSGLPDLLEASDTNSYQFKYHYRDNAYYTRTNRRITDRQLRSAVNKVSEKQKSEMRKQTQQLIAGAILTSVWYLRMEDLMAVLYKTLWTLAIGGFLFDDDAARNAFYLFVLAQFKWLDNFRDQIENRSQPLDGTAMNRAGLYGVYGNSFYQNAILEKMITAGYTEGKRILGPNENHCYKTHERLGCIELASKGWVPIEQVVPIGNATCYSNCHCYLVYR